MDKLLGFFIEKKRFLLLIVFMSILLMISLACTLPFKIVWTGNAEENQEKTAQASTAIAQNLTAEAPQPSETPDKSGEGESDAEAELPSETPSLTPSPTITDTPTPEQVTAYISKNTNCRSGPKDVFELIHIFLGGDKVDLLGKNQEESFWFVQDQAGGNIQCWIWNEYASTEGMTENLPVFTPPPDPAPILNFILSYNNTTGGTKVSVKLFNTGNLALQSYSATFIDTVTAETVIVSGNSFRSAAKISVGNTGVVPSSAFSASTIGHQMKATLKACSKDGQAGKCVTHAINFESK